MSDRWIGNFKKGQVIRVKFNTFSQAKVPATPSVNPVVTIYKDSVTEFTTGVTQPTIDFDGRSGVHEFVIDTSDAVYEVGKDYDVMLTAGTVDGLNLSRTIIRTFSIENRLIDVNVIQVAGQTANAAAAVTFPASVASETTLGNRPTLAQIEGSTILAKESTLADKASQASVNLIPTNPLRDNDSRLLNLDFPISSVNTAIGNLNNLSALINIYGSPLLEIPDAGSTLYAFTIVVRDNEGKLVNLDALPTVTASNAAGTSRSANLSSVTNPSTGRYIFTYSVSSTHLQENLRIVGSGTVSGESRYIEWIGSVVNYDTLTVLQSVQTTVNSIDTRLPALPAAVSDIPTANQNRDAVMNAMPNGGWVNGSFGDRWIISNNSNRTIGVTGAGSGHVQVDVHQMQPNVMTASALATDAVTEIVTGVWTRDLSTFTGTAAGKTVYDTGTGVSTLLSRIIDGTAALITDLRTMIAGTGTSLVKWTVNALSNAPSGGGGQTITAVVAVPQLLEHTAFELDEVIVYRGCHWSFQVQNLGDLAGYTEIWFTLRKRQNDKDAESALQISLTQGLFIANKSTSVTSTDGSLTVSGQNVTIQVKQAVTQFVEPSNNYDYDLKGRNGAGQTIMLHESDKFIVKRDVTRRIS